jgi:hypothetical protein
VRLFFKAKRSIHIRRSTRATKTGKVVPVSAHEQQRRAAQDAALREIEQKRVATGSRTFTDKPTEEFFDYCDGPRWNGKVAASGLPADFAEPKYKEWSDANGTGPCGVLSAVNREDKGLAVAACGAKEKGAPDDLPFWFPHYVNFDKKTGAIIDETNPFDQPLDYRAVYVLPDDEMPELADEQSMDKMRKVTGRAKP